MKKMTSLSAIACVSCLSCNKEPENPENQTTGKNPVVGPGGNTSIEIFSPGINYENPDPTPSKLTVEELRDKIKEFKHVDNNNVLEFIQTIEELERNGGEKVSVTEATIKNNKLTFEILGIKGTMNLMLNETVSEKQKHFEYNIYAIQWLNSRGEKLEFPLNINTFPLEFIIYFDYFGPNLDEIKKINGNHHNKKFSLEKGVVKLDGNDCFKLDSLDYFHVLADGLSNESRHCFFDDTFFKNPITWQPNGEISCYGGANCALFENDFVNLNCLLSHLVSMQKVGIPIDKIKIEQTSDSIKLGGYPLNEDIWTNYYFWNNLRQYASLFDYGDGIRIKEENDVFVINEKPIKKVGQYKKYITSNPIFKLERAN